jgi:N,N-dimethylformamidase beta subunit-like protein
VIALYAFAEEVVYPGDTATVCVSTTAATFRLDLYHLGASMRLVWQSAEFPGRLSRPASADRDWDWPRYDLAVPPSAPPGVYLVVGTEIGFGTTRSLELVGYDGTALLVISPRERRARHLLKLPVRTYQAYNPAGGSSLYVNHLWHADHAVVTTRRPGGGVGGPTTEPVDALFPGSARQTFWHWDAPFLRWAASAGYEFDVVLDTQLDTHPELLAGYGLIVSVGHDEYWTSSGRRVIEQYLDEGGSLAVLGGNTCWWRTEVSGSLICVAKDPSNLSAGDLWWRSREPEESLFGLSYRHGGGWWAGTRPDSRYVMTKDDDALLEGVDREAFGRVGTLAGYEVDGHVYDPAKPFFPDSGSAAPVGLRILGYAELDSQNGGSWDQPERESRLDCRRVASIAYYRRGNGWVFNAGTTDWALHLHEPSVSRLTMNVLDLLTSPSNG